MTGHEKIQGLMAALADAGLDETKYCIVVSAELEKEVLTEAREAPAEEWMFRLAHIYVCNGMVGVAVVHQDLLEGFLDMVRTRE